MYHSHSLVKGNYREHTTCKKTSTGVAHSPPAETTTTLLAANDTVKLQGRACKIEFLLLISFVPTLCPALLLRLTFELRIGSTVLVVHLQEMASAMEGREQFVQTEPLICFHLAQRRCFSSQKTQAVLGDDSGAGYIGDTRYRRHYCPCPAHQCRCSFGQCILFARARQVT